MEEFYDELMALVESSEAAPIELIGALELAKHLVIANLDAEDEA